MLCGLERPLQPLRKWQEGYEEGVSAGEGASAQGHCATVLLPLYLAPLQEDFQFTQESLWGLSWHAFFCSVSSLFI